MMNLGSVRENSERGLACRCATQATTTAATLELVYRGPAPTKAVDVGAGSDRFGSRPWKNGLEHGPTHCVSPGREGRNSCRSAGARGLEQCDQVLIASVSGPTPKIVIIRLRL